MYASLLLVVTTALLLLLLRVILILMVGMRELTRYRERYTFAKLHGSVHGNDNMVSPRNRRDDMRPPRRWQFDNGKNRGWSTSVRGRVRSPHISGGRRWLSCRPPACLYPRQLRHGTDSRTDRVIPKCP